jgi:ABC-type transport system involved in cytochrome bd biosynthesis fused ATPase/permease subunit
VCLFIYHYVLKDNLENSTAFFSLLAVVSIQIVHISKNIARTLSVYARFKGTRDKIDLIINNENVRQSLETKEFESAAILDLDYTYDDKYTKNTIHIRIPEFHVDKGDIICIHGESGQGKTTLLHVLSGEIESDCVYLNGDKTDKRIECVFIAQDTEILDMSIKDNLALGNANITDEMLVDHLAAVGLKDWYDCQEQGLDTILGERGVFVSTGQRQRLNLIRGLLINDKEIYLLDEPTSNVDDQTEDAMIELIKNALKDKTAIIVTHKPKIKNICNHSYAFNGGVLSKEY